MKKSKLSFKMLSLLSVITLSFAFGFTALGGVRQSHAFTTSDSAKYVKVDEIWDESSHGFKEDNLLKLLKFVSGDDGFTMKKFSDLYKQAENRKTALEIRNSVVPEKSNQQDVVVTYGGKDWTVTYLSLDKNGDVILTLWLADVEPDLTSTMSEGSEIYGDTNKVGWINDTEIISSYARASSANDERPDALYGSSHIRAVVLNNGGSYNGWDYDNANFDASIAPKTTELTATKQDNALYARFTVDKGDGFLDYIDSPRDVAWQENGEYAQQTLSFEYNLSNEMWSNEITDEGFSLEYEIPTWVDGDVSNEGYFSDGGYTEYTMNMAKKEANDAWADDKLWLPSMSEIGYCRGQAGLWKTTMEQRSASENYFTRTMKNNSTNHVYAISKDATCYIATQVIDLAAIRPALHLNISKALKTNAGDVTDISVEGTLKAGDQFDQNKLTVFALHANGYINTVSDNLSFAGYSGETPLEAGQKIDVTYNGHTAEYTVLQTTLTNDEFTLRSQVGFDANATLEINKFTEQDDIKDLVGETSYQQLGTVDALYQISAKNNDDVLVDDSANIRVSTKAFQGECKYYTYEDGKLTQVWADPSKNITINGTEVTFIVVRTSPIVEQQPTPGGDVDIKPSTQTPAAPQDTTGIILAFVFSMLAVICIAVVLLLLFGKKRGKNK